MSKLHCIWCNKPIGENSVSNPDYYLTLLGKTYVFCNHCVKEILVRHLIDKKLITRDLVYMNSNKITLTLENTEGKEIHCDLCDHKELIKEPIYYKLTIGEKVFNICGNNCLHSIFLDALLPDDSSYKPDVMEGLDDFYDGHKQLVEEPKQIGNTKVNSESIEDINVSKDKLATPREIKKIMDQYVIGQDKAKKILSVAVYEHYKQIKALENAKNKDDILTTKKNILILGPTGCGKTHLTRVLANILKVPFFTAIAYNYTEEGYVGLSVNEMLKDLYLISGKDLEATQRGIIYIDEIDKIAKSNSSNGPDVNGASVQQALLSLVEGAVVPVQVGQGKKVMIDTRNILFIAGGAFTDIIPIVNKRLNKNQKKSIGFSLDTNDSNSKQEIDEDVNLYELIKPQDLFNYGMLEEFIGRFPTFAPIASLTQKDLVKILTETKNSLIDSYVQTFKIDNIDLIFTDGALNEIARQSLERKTGARGLDGIIDPIIKELEFEVAGDEDVISCTITEDVIKGLSEPLVKRRSDA